MCTKIHHVRYTNNQLPRCDIAWLHVTTHIYHGFPCKTIKQSHASSFDCLTVYLGKP